MSVTVYGRHDDDAVFEDDNGPARIPLRALAMLHHAADTAVFRPAYAAGFLVGHFVGGVALILSERVLS
jgi:hypothetical protein